MKKQIYKYMILFTLILALVIVGVIVKKVVTPPIDNSQFDPERWDKYPALRHEMIEDMEEKIDIWNLKREEILEILGTNHVSIFTSEDIKKGLGVTKDLDFEYYHSYLIDSGAFMYEEYYDVTFDKDGNVIRIGRSY